VIATPTLYRDGLEDSRFGFAFQMLAAARGAGYPVVVVDGSPSPKVVHAFQCLGAHVFRGETPGLGAQKRESVVHALELAPSLGATIIAMIEPEKVNLIDFMPRFVHPLVEGRADVVVATRTEQVRFGYPTFQREGEQAIDCAFKEATGIPIDDISMGPVAFRTEVAGCFTDTSGYLVEGVQDTYIQHYGTIVAYAKGLRVMGSEPLACAYPQSQRRIEEGAQSGEMRAKRIWQRDSLIIAYQALARRYGLPRRVTEPAVS